MNDEVDKQAEGELPDADDWVNALETEMTGKSSEPSSTGSEPAAPGSSHAGPETQSSPAPRAPAREEATPLQMDQLKDAGNAIPASSEALAKDDAKLEVILDIPVRLSMEVGNTEISIRNLLQLNQGSVIELDRRAGEPLDVLVNGTLIAHGEVVVVNEKFGIRLTDVISTSERIKRLK